MILCDSACPRSVARVKSQAGPPTVVGLLAPWFPRGGVTDLLAAQVIWPERDHLANEPLKGAGARPSSLRAKEGSLNAIGRWTRRSGINEIEGTKERENSCKTRVCPSCVNRRAECLSHSLAEKLPEGDYRHLVVTPTGLLGILERAKLRGARPLLRSDTGASSDSPGG